MKIQPFTNLDTDGKNFNILKPFFRKRKDYGRAKNINIIDTVVLHWTAGASVKSAADTLLKKGYGYHFLIDRKGEVFQGAPVIHRVAHAGSSYGPNGKDVNEYSIGISFDMLTGKEEFTPEMYESTSNLIKDLKLSVPNLKYITGHHWISPGRKIDPYTFDFNTLMGMLGGSYEIWKTGYLPFPTGLTGCKCLKVDDNGNCVESDGGCIGQGGYSYSEKKLSTEVKDISFGSDLVTE